VFLLDTNTVSLSFRAPTPALARRFQTAPPASLFLSSIVEAEIRYGIAKKREAGAKLARLFDLFLSKVTVLPWTSASAREFAQLRTASEAAGVTIATVDLMIATSAKEHDLTLVTHDGALFQLRPWLRVEDWA
jgi:tRNA(fMet)-specific endonuclease VapC